MLIQRYWEALILLPWSSEIEKFRVKDVNDISMSPVCLEHKAFARFHENEVWVLKKIWIEKQITEQSSYLLDLIIGIKIKRMKVENQKYFTLKMFRYKKIGGDIIGQVWLN